MNNKKKLDNQKEKKNIIKPTVEVKHSIKMSKKKSKNTDE